MSHRYEIVIRPLTQEDGGGFVALVPELPGCMSDGETEEDALRNVKDAMSAWFATAETSAETHHLLANPNNAARLRRSMAQMEKSRPSSD